MRGQSIEDTTTNCGMFMRSQKKHDSLQRVIPYRNNGLVKAGYDVIAHVITSESPLLVLVCQCNLFFPTIISDLDSRLMPY